MNGDRTVLKIFAISWGLLAATATQLHAHEFWLDPSNFTPKAGAQVPVVLRNGMNFLGDSYPFVKAQSKRFTITDGQGERRIKAVEGDDPAANVAVPIAGLSVVAFQRAPDLVTYQSVSHFLETLDDEGLDAIAAQYRALQTPPKTIRESYARFAKTLLSVGAGGGNDRAVGLALEIVVETNPYMLAKDAPLSVRVLQAGKPVEGVQIKAFNRADAQSPRRVRSDVEGRALLPSVAVGETLLSAVVMAPGDPSARDQKLRADWISLWASVTFKRP
jgi:uncharacterized GH25 family protein